MWFAAKTVLEASIEVRKGWCRGVFCKGSVGGRWGRNGKLGKLFSSYIIANSIAVLTEGQKFSNWSCHIVDNLMIVTKKTQKAANLPPTDQAAWGRSI